MGKKEIIIVDGKCVLCNSITKWLIKKDKNTSILEINKPTSKLKFSDYFKNYRQYLRVISLEEFKKNF